MILPAVKDRQPEIVAQLEALWRRGKDARGDITGPVTGAAGAPKYPGLEKLWEECLHAYESKHAPGVTIPDGRSGRYLPYAHTAAQTILAELVSALFPVPDFFRVEATQATDEQFERPIAVELQYLLDEMGFVEQMRGLMLYLVIYGTAPYILDWQTRTVPVVDGLAPVGGWRAVVERLKAGVTGKPVQMEQKVTERTVYDGARMQIVDPRHVVFDPNPPAEADLARVWRILWQERTLAELRQMAREFPGVYSVLENLDRLEGRDMGGGGADMDQSQQLDAVRMGGIGQRKAGFEVKTFWGDFEGEGPSKDLVYRNCVATWVGTTLLRFEHNPAPDGLPPLKVLTYQASGKPGQVYGVSALEPGLGVGSLANAVFNQFIDWVSKIIKGDYMVRDGSPAHLKGRRHGEPWIVDSLTGDVAPLAFNANVFEVQRLIPMLEIMYAKATGAPLTHTVDEVPRTATEQSQLRAVMDTRRKETLKHISSQLEEFFDSLVALRAKYGPQEPVTRRVMAPGKDEESWESIPPEAFSRHFRIRMIGSGMLTQKAEQIAGMGQTIEAIQALAPLDPTIAQRLKGADLIQKYHTMLTGFDQDELFAPTNPVEEMLLAADSPDAGGLPTPEELASLAAGPGGLQ